MLRLKPSNVTPPDKYKYRFPQDGFVATAFDRDAWFGIIDKHYKDNPQFEQPDNWREIAEDALCRRLSGEWCTGGTENSFIKTRFTFDDLLRGAKTALTGRIVEPEIAVSRALICSRCVANVPVPGCSGCSGLANLVASLKGAKKTPHDHLLKACGVCHCSNEAQVWYSAEDLAAGVTPDMMATYREIAESDGCWKYEAISGNH